MEREEEEGRQGWSAGGDVKEEVEQLEEEAGLEIDERANMEWQGCQEL